MKSELFRVVGNETCRNPQAIGPGDMSVSGLQNAEIVKMHIAEIIPFPNPVSSISNSSCETQAAADPPGDSETEQMLEARARIRKVLDDLDRLNGELSQLIIEG